MTGAMMSKLQAMYSRSKAEGKLTPQQQGSHLASRGEASARNRSCPTIHTISAKLSSPPGPTSSQLFLALRLQHVTINLHNLAFQHLPDSSLLPRRPIPQHVRLNCLGAV
jgi:hypothetical protein